MPSFLFSQDTLRPLITISAGIYGEGLLIGINYDRIVFQKKILFVDLKAGAGMATQGVGIDIFSGKLYSQLGLLNMSELISEK